MNRRSNAAPKSAKGYAAVSKNGTIWAVRMTRDNLYLLGIGDDRVIPVTITPTRKRK